jgi:Transcriptional regulators
LDIAKDLFYAQQTLVTLFSVTNKLQMQGDKHLQDITIRQMLAIPALVHAPDGKATINHLARSMGTTKQSAKQIVDAMERKGYLSVVPSEQDKRAVNVTVTPEGQKAFRVCSERTDEFLADIFCNLNAEELETLCFLLKKLYCFDGAEQESFDGHIGYDASVSDDILRHHQTFARQREKAKESE